MQVIADNGETQVTVDYQLTCQVGDLGRVRRKCVFNQTYSTFGIDDLIFDLVYQGLNDVAKTIINMDKNGKLIWSIPS